MALSHPDDLCEELKCAKSVCEYDKWLIATWYSKPRAAQYSKPVLILSLSEAMHDCVLNAHTKTLHCMHPGLVLSDYSSSD